MYNPPPPRPKLAHEQIWEWFQHHRRSGKVIICSVVLFLALSLCICSTTANTNNQAVAQPTIVITRQPAQQIVPTAQPTPTPSPSPIPKPTPTDTPVPTQPPELSTEAPAQPAPPAQAPSTGERTGAACNDGTTSLATGSGACSHHHGVDHWLYN